jgi:hypothetical protein
MTDRKTNAPWRKPPGVDHVTTQKDGAPSTARGQAIPHDIEDEMEGRDGMPVTRKIRSPGDLPD